MTVDPPEPPNRPGRPATGPTADRSCVRLQPDGDAAIGRGSGCEPDLDRLRTGQPDCLARIGFVGADSVRRLVPPRRRGSGSCCGSNDEVVAATLADTPAGREFADHAAVTLDLRDPMGQAKSGRLPAPIDTAGATTILDPDAGGIYYVPDRAMIAIYYDDLGQTVPAPGLVPLGALDADLGAGTDVDPHQGVAAVADAGKLDEGSHRCGRSQQLVNYNQPTRHRRSLIRTGSKRIRSHHPVLIDQFDRSRRSSIVRVAVMYRPR